MKTLQLLNQQIEALRDILGGSQKRDSSATAPTSQSRSSLGVATSTRRATPTRSNSETPSSQSGKSASQKVRQHWLPAPVSFALAIATLTGTIGQRFYNKPELEVGTPAPQTIYAPESAKVADPKTTEEKRNAAQIALVPVLMPDVKIDRQIDRELDRVLERGSELRNRVKPFPYLAEEILPLSNQRYLRNCSVWEWQAIWAKVSENEPDTPTPKSVTPNTDKNQEELLDAIRHAASGGLSKGLTQIVGNPSTTSAPAIDRLKAYRQQVSPEEFEATIREINLARQRYSTALAELAPKTPSPDQPIYTRALFDLSDREWEALQEGVRTVKASIVAQGIPEGLPDEILERAVSLQLQTIAPDAPNDIATSILVAVLEPNLRQDPERTRQRSEKAMQAVEMVYATVERYEPIVVEGEEITQSDFVLLDHFGYVRRTLVNWRGLFGFGSIVCLAVGIYWLVERRVLPRARGRDRLLILLLSLSTPLLVLLQLPTTSLPAVGLLSGSFYGSTLGSVVVVLSSLLLAIGIGPTLEVSYPIAGAIAGLLGAAIAGRIRCREELALLGLGVGVTHGVAHAIVNLILSAAAGPVSLVLLGAAGLQALVGVAWSVVAIGVSPYLEHLFDLVTPIRLAELSNPNRPLLQRLSREAPGTFQHTLFVATLAEAAARDLRCNVELVRAGTLYHDIGKMHDPLGFVENQMGGPNKHDKINNPWLSAKIIKKHVSEGEAMARRARLPKAVQAFIPEHQGTMLIAYFYHQAKQNYKGRRQVREEDFRYPGPIPQSRETGIVMLADSCEAALRSLDDATPEQALSMVNKILRARWQDRQLVDSGLTREDLSKIADIFVRVWQQFNHKRIAYPKAVLSPTCQAR
ncbi:MAG TPA: HDIG domain-containing protein [Oscillatoriales cyanobacterium M4454_W2019_049]|nr:MAG: HDIG domain-containing protein [Cyanobacteria bacterium J055]HIK32974.1 HDIG domain-containing protein [Oscillatoriales cyanobacterium M4454_W2019_049]